ncbi:cyclophane-containing peptide 2OG-Fe(II) oxygenase YhhC [Methylobacterium iners]|uniref:Prolyl 3,4-dihydroxylase TPA1/OFD1 N-terminal domain-containing protein n=1 Tax=Methylobacterium iners TaxID=418707 RepID=A0ABQ4S3H7_9HYPH|nr:cyclophane-containing peptide 2OG-Fe(II) oxygenase YhhC [Methylobacterium iners]GJD97686.1 hypothetical protein OCOJLMKI_4919 [Methylobacterium iners]
MLPNFSNAKLSNDPFPHMRVPGILDSTTATGVLEWLKTQAPWVLRVESFYEQHEFSLLAADLDGSTEALTMSEFVGAVRDKLQASFSVAADLILVDIAAHRLTAGQTIRIHNDYLDSGEETHRLLIQLNDGWNSDRGGLLMLFADEHPGSLKSIVMPAHASGFAFEISHRSFHAVSSINFGERYTLVYTFRKAAA